MMKNIKRDETKLRMKLHKQETPEFKKKESDVPIIILALIVLMLAFAIF